MGGINIKEALFTGFFGVYLLTVCAKYATMVAGKNLVILIMKLRTIVIAVGGGAIASYLFMWIVCIFYNHVTHNTIKESLPSQALFPSPKPPAKVAPPESKTEPETLHYEGLHVNPTIAK